MSDLFSTQIALFLSWSREEDANESYKGKALSDQLWSEFIAVMSVLEGVSIPQKMSELPDGRKEGLDND